MPLVTANGAPVVAADFVLPISRAWHVDMTVATNDASKVNGSVTIDINDSALQMKGTASVEDVYLETVRARVIAGADGLGKAANPKAYQQASVKIVLNDLLQTAGETMSSTADAGVLGMQLNAWVVSQMPVGDAIDLLMKRAGASWRLLADGTFWCGSESWPDADITFSIEQEDKAHQQMIVTMEAPLLLPGVMLDGRKIGYVETHVDHKVVRSTAWVAGSTAGDRLRDPLVAMVKSSLPQIDYLGLYRAKVVSQSGNACDLIPDDPRLPQGGFQAVPIRHGVPGLSVTVSSGAYVLLGWQNGDQSKPYCCLWEGGESAQSIQIAGNTPVARKGDHSGGGAMVFAFAPGTGGATLSITYTDPDGTVTTLSSGSGSIPLKAKLNEGSNIVGVG